MQKGGLFMKYLSKILTFVIVLVMVFSLSIPVFAADASAYPNVIDSVETQNEQIDYASIVERLDIDELDNFIQAEKSSHPEITEKVLEEKLKAKILQDGLDKKIIFIDNDGNITFNKGVTDGSVFYSYSDLPIIKSKLRNNEKRVFNKSLIKGLGVLSSGQTARLANKSIEYGDGQALFVFCKKGKVESYFYIPYTLADIDYTRLPKTQTVLRNEAIFSPVENKTTQNIELQFSPL